MGWTISWFDWQQRRWKERLESPDIEDRALGLKEYGYKQCSLWTSLRDAAKSAFSGIINPLSSR